MRFRPGEINLPENFDECDPCNGSGIAYVTVAERPEFGDVASIEVCRQCGGTGFDVDWEAIESQRPGKSPGGPQGGGE